MITQPSSPSPPSSASSSSSPPLRCNPPIGLSPTRPHRRRRRRRRSANRTRRRLPAAPHGRRC
ncbi:unnamed protein product [Spirodela intermedia]|uniref:Uncharacterized protein n=1 Tax=Spirodela intermedia TaxID=51605 RepID=A0ABN7EDX5_SPIIN|nr:unnamed protein product [Spirodela intermedia]